MGSGLAVERGYEAQLAHGLLPPCLPCRRRTAHLWCCSCTGAALASPSPPCGPLCQTLPQHATPHATLQHKRNKNSHSLAYAISLSL